MAVEGVFAVQVDGIQELEVLPNNAPLENPLHFKTTSRGITVGEDVKDYPHVLIDWYTGPMEHTDVAESIWKYVEIKTKEGECRQMRFGPLSSC